MKSRSWRRLAGLTIALAIAVWGIRSFLPSEPPPSVVADPAGHASATDWTERGPSATGARSHANESPPPTEGKQEATAEHAASGIGLIGLIVQVEGPDAQPLGDVPVHWTSGTTSEWRSEKTASNGRLAVEHPTGACFLVNVAGQTKTASSSMGPARATFVIRPFRLIRVLVTDPVGVPVPGASVKLGSIPNPRASSFAGVTGEDGRISVLSYHERDCLSADKSGWRPSRRLPVLAAHPPNSGGASDAAYAMRITLEPVHASDVLSGRVTDQYGRPVTGARLRWHAEVPLLRHRGFLSRGPLPVEVVADAAGRFAIRLCGQSGRLQVSAPSFAERWITLAAEDYLPTGLPDIVLEPAISVSGTVLGPDGRAVAGARVRAESPQAAPADVLSDISGRFVLEGLKAGPDTTGGHDRPGINISAFHETQGSGSIRADVSAGQVTDVTVALDGDNLSGTVRRGSTPVIGARIRIRGSVRDSARGGWAQVDYHVETRDPAGTFTIARPSSDSWELLVEPQGDGESAVLPLALPGADLETPVDIDLDLLQARRGTLALRVIDSSLQPVGTYYLRLAPSEIGRRARSALCTARSGRFRVAVPAGGYEVYVSPAGGGVAHRIGQFQIQANRTLDLGDFVVAEPGSIHGTLEGLTNERSGLIAYVSVAHGRLTAHVWTGGFGDLHVEHIAPGTYTMRPHRASQIDFDATTVEVRPGAPTRVQLIGHPCWQGSLVVRLPNGARGSWQLRYKDCQGLTQQIGFQVPVGNRGHARIDGMHLWRGTSTVSIGPAAEAMREHRIEPKNSNLLWIDAR